MKASKKRKLESKGWTVGTVEQFLDMSQEEATYLEMKLRLAETLRKLRKDRSLTQMALAKRLKSSQSRVAKMEGGDRSVSLDLLIRTLLALGASQKDVGSVIHG